MVFLRAVEKYVINSKLLHEARVLLIRMYKSDKNTIAIVSISRYKRSTIISRDILLAINVILFFRTSSTPEKRLVSTYFYLQIANFTTKTK